MRLSATQFPSSTMQTDKEIEYTDNDFSRVQRIAYKMAGLHLPNTKKILVHSRVSRRIRAHKFTSFKHYLDFVETQQGSKELEELICSLTTNTTHFFRENKHFEHLEEVVIPPMNDRLKNGEIIRMWSAACSTGQEPWSMSMSILQHIPNILSYNFKILATDINSQVVERAASGTYPLSELDGIPLAYRNKFMRPDSEDRFHFQGAIKQIPVFKTLNLNKSWPMQGRFLAIFCRNVVIYFDEETRNMLWKRLSDKLEEGGFLYIGHSERVSNPSDYQLEQVAPTIYKRVR